MPNLEKDVASAESHGINRIVEQYRERFRVPENLDYYSESDYHEAERQYLRYCLTNGSC